MKRFGVSVLLVFTMLSFTGCANKVHDYSVSTDNISFLKAVSKSGKRVNIGTFTDSNKNESKVMCRLATPVGTPEGKTFATYIQDAFKKELVIADIYNKNAKNTITVNLDDMHGNTMLGNAYWEFKTTVKSSNGVTYNINSKYTYESSFSAMSACSEMQRSFVPAVQKLNGKIIQHPKFMSLLK